MGALLKIVQPPTVVAQESACRVLNAGLVDRLGAMNAAVRTLRDMGYRVVAQTLFPVRGGKPEVLIASQDYARRWEELLKPLWPGASPSPSASPSP